MRTLFSRIKAFTSKREVIPNRTADAHPRIAGVPDELAIEIDANGSPVTVQEAHWFICFVPGLQRQWWHRFANARHKHVFALRMVDDDRWLLVEPWWTRQMVNVLTLDEAMKFLRWGAAGDILEVREAIPGRGSQVRGWSNCSVQMAYLLGRSYWTWTPHGLYRRLKADPGVKAVELSRFLREHFQFVANSNADAALRLLPRGSEKPLQELLLDLGTGVMTALMSPTAIALHKAVVSEYSRFGETADALWTFGPERAIGRIREALEDAKQRGEVNVEDCATAARHFLAMLRGDLHLEVILGIRSSPDPNEIRRHVMSVVAVFLRGAWPRGKLQLLRVASNYRAASLAPSSMASAC